MLKLGPGYVPAFVTEEVLPSAPVAGGGVHRFLFDLSRVLSPYRTTDAIDHILHDYAAQCGRHVPETEINSAIRNGQRYACRGSASGAHVRTDHYNLGNCTSNPSSRTPEPQFDPEAFSNFVAGHDNIDAQWLAARSPVCPWNRTPASLLHALYRKEENIVIFDDYRSQGQALWTHPGLPYDARALNVFAKGKRLGVWFLCNPVDGQFRPNDEGKLSRRSWQNVTSGATWSSSLIATTSAPLTGSRHLPSCASQSPPSASREAAYLMPSCASTPQAKNIGIESATTSCLCLS